MHRQCSSCSCARASTTAAAAASSAVQCACGGVQGERLQLSIANCLHSRAVRRRNRRTAGDDDPLASAPAAQ